MQCTKSHKRTAIPRLYSFCTATCTIIIIVQCLRKPSYASWQASENQTRHILTWLKLKQGKEIGRFKTKQTFVRITPCIWPAFYHGVAPGEKQNTTPVRPISNIFGVVVFFLFASTIQSCRSSDMSYVKWKPLVPAH